MVGDDEPGGEIVAAVQHEVDADQQLGHRAGIAPLRASAVPLCGMEGRACPPAYLGLNPSYFALSDQTLPLEVVEGHLVVVDHPQRPDAGRGEILDGRRADAPGSDDG